MKHEMDEEGALYFTKYMSTIWFPKSKRNGVLMISAPLGIVFLPILSR
ncbi:hypothetical protein GI364_09555 [Alicyclobacillus sp. SO9]|nr:hypothetical protein GI364_09555 [Alicyclobacillus sp. SO9]